MVSTYLEQPKMGSKKTGCTNWTVVQIKQSSKPAVCSYYGQYFLYQSTVSPTSLIYDGHIKRMTYPVRVELEENNKIFWVIKKKANHFYSFLDDFLYTHPASKEMIQNHVRLSVFLFDGFFSSVLLRREFIVHFPDIDGFSLVHFPWWNFST